jgi:hypothetical protein
MSHMGSSGKQQQHSAAALSRKAAHLKILDTRHGRRSYE